MKTIDALIMEARSLGCSDIHITAGEPIFFRRVGRLEQQGPALDREEGEALCRSILTEEQRQKLARGEDLDFAYVRPGEMRQRVNVYRERGRTCCAIRLLSGVIPSLEELGLPAVLQRLALLPRGLILVTGPTGSGKSTTLAAMVDHINRNRDVHILTIEDPIEYEHHNRRGMIHQREVGRDVDSFAGALRSALREDPDVILVGEMRDYETISAALTAAETGHLVLSTLHTTGAANTVDRIIDVFPAAGQHQVRTQLGGVLQGIITQQLLPTRDGTRRVAALEILTGNDAVHNLIRDNKGFQLGSIMETGTREGMQTMTQALSRLANQGIISRETALAACSSPEELRQYLN